MLLDKYGSSLYVTYDGYCCIITISKHQNIEDEKKRIILTAARILKSEIKELSAFDRTQYPAEEYMANENE